MKRGVISFVFDDGYEQIFRTVVPLLNQFQIKGVFAIPLDSQRVAVTEGRSVVSWQEWLRLKAYGHEIAAHSTHHLNLTSLDKDQLVAELKQPKDTLNATTLVYPGGSYNEHVVAITRQYYRSARTVRAGFEKIPPSDPFTLHSYNFSKNNFSVARANLLAVWAYITNQWLIETYHLIDDQEKSKIHSIPLTSFKKHVEFVSRLPIAIKTIENVIGPQ